MKTYIYVVAYEPKGFEKGDPIAFRHWQMKEQGEGNAYLEGMRKHDKKIKGKLLNNYVIKVKMP